MGSLATRGNRAHAAHALPCVLRSAQIIGSFSRLRSMMRENNTVVPNMMNRWIRRARDKVSKRRIAERRNAAIRVCDDFGNTRDLTRRPFERRKPAPIPTYHKLRDKWRQANARAKCDRFQ